MKLLIDFFPIVIFFIFYKTMGLYAAIYAITGATLLQLLIMRYRTGKFEKMHVITFALLLVFGGVSIAVRDPAFIMWKVSVLYVIFALALIASIYIGEKTIMQRILGKELTLSVDIWRAITWIWGAGFTIIAIVNGYYVNLAVSARDRFFANTNIDTSTDLTQINCATTTMQDLCDIAQQTEQSWVNFKLFGSMGMTLLLVVITMVFIMKIAPKQISKINK